MSRILGLGDSDKLQDSAIDYYMHQRSIFVDKIEGGIPNSQVSLLQIVDFTKDYFEAVSFKNLFIFLDFQNKQLGALILE